MTTTPLTDQQLDDIAAKAAELRERLDRKNPWPSDNESHWTAEGWKSGTRNALDKLHVEGLVAEVRRLRAAQPQPVVVPDKDTPLSEYDFVELVAFAHKVESEGFGYAFEEYPPHFEAPELAPIADDYSLLRQLHEAWEEALDEFWTRPDAEAVYDAHIDEARRRRQEQRAAAVETDGTPA